MLIMVGPIAVLWFYTDWAEPGSSERRAAQAAPQDLGRALGREGAGAAY